MNRHDAVNRPLYVKRLIVGIAAVSVLTLILVFVRIRLPFGHREAFMRSMDSVLQNYAVDHSGWFPDGKNSHDALVHLFPDYCPFGLELAGLSGDIQKLTNALQMGESISNLTSWVYVPGLREDDDSRLAILWESRPGLSAGGRLVSGGQRPVLLLNRDITNVPAVHWEDFLKQQELLRNAVQTNRETATKQQLPKAL
jgi:hypothetical protein